MYTFTHENGEVEVLFRPWTVRTYYLLKRNHIEVNSEDDCITAGDLCLANKVRNGGLKMACELYRAGGLGIYNIFDRMDGRLSLERIRFLCEDLIDRSLHGPWD